MIDKSKYCVIYYDEIYSPPKGKSGTKIAYYYAVKEKREIINKGRSKPLPYDIFF